MILHTPIDEPDHVIVIDPSLIRRDVAQRMKPGGTIVLRKVRRALDTRGFRFLLFLSPCPSGWKSDPAAGIDLIGLAVGCGLFALYKVFDGQRFRINARPDGTPIEDYLSRQGRFRSATVDVDAMREDIKQFWAHLERLEEAYPEPNDGRNPPHASTLRHWAPLQQGEQG